MNVNNYLILDNFLSDSEIDNVLNKIINKDEKKLGMYGNSVKIDQKNRYEYKFDKKNLIFLEKKIDENKIRLYKEFGHFLIYHEAWKFASYNGKQKGFYTEHRDNQGKVKHRNVSCVCMLSSFDDYKGGEFHFPELGVEIRLKKGSVLFFNSNLLHGVKPVTEGERFVAVNFLFDTESLYKRLNYDKIAVNNMAYKRDFLLPLTPNSGPGNQIISIKEALLLSKLLNRVCILPPIHSHYTSKKRVIWNFNEIFEVDDFLCCYYDRSKTYNFDNIYGCHGKYTLQTLKLEKILDIKDKKIHLLKKRVFKDVCDIDELKEKNDKILCLKHLWNHVHFNECSTNGCSHCDYNKNFKQMYNDMCYLFDFSGSIKAKGHDYIKKNLNNNFISVHLRYPDNMNSTKSFKDFIDYDEEMIYNAIEKLKEKNSIDSVFIATNNVNAVKNSKLQFYSTYNIDTENPINSFIEQYICCCSKIFVLSRFNDYKKKDEKHIRSTWSSFVYDYRIFKNKNTNNIYLDTIL